MILLYIIIASIAEMLVALAGIFFVFLGSGKLKKYIAYFISFAVGTLLAVIFLSILPEAIEEASANVVLGWTLIGFLFFFLLSRGLHWYHHHHENGVMCDGDNKPIGCVSPDKHPDKNIKSSGYLVLMGDFVHNAIDGVIITLAFTADVKLGIATTIAVLFHELPQEIADFFILVNAGFSRKKALLMNFLSSSATPIVAVLTYFLIVDAEKVIGPALGLVAGNFLYIAASDLIPELHAWHKSGGSTVRQFALILLGIALMYGILVFIPE